MVGVQDEQHVQCAGQVLVHLVRLGGEAERQAQEVLHRTQRVVRVEERLADDYFIDRKLYPNVDFYTGVIYRAMGFPTKYFTVLFALGRLPGWIAHWREMMADPQTRIGRPRQLYSGYSERNYVEIGDRG